MNYFILLQYIHYVESNTNQELLKPYALADRIKRAMVSAVDDMCGVDRKRTDTRTRNLAEEANDKIDTVLHSWWRTGLIDSDYID